MRGRKVAVFVAGAMFTTLLGWSSAGPALAGASIQYAGRGIAITEVAPGLTTTSVDTGELASSGGILEASALSGSTASASGEALHATVIAQVDRTRSEASLTHVLIAVGQHRIAADFVMSRTEAVKSGSGVTLTGKSHIDSVLIDGIAIPVTGLPNQGIPLPDGVLVLNEQSTSTSGAIRSITVHAMHLTVGSVDVYLGTSKAGVSTGSTNCSGNSDAATGGGWIQPPGATAKRSFGIVGGVRQSGDFFGHVVYVNHETGARLRGRVNNYVDLGTSRLLQGNGDVNGQPVAFTVRVEDRGEPGTLDTFSVVFTGGQAADEGTLVGGNIQFHPMCR